MSALFDLINQITDEKLRERIRQEAKHTVKDKTFGLVFERHLPECSLLYGVPVREGNKIVPLVDREDGKYKTSAMQSIWRIIRIEGEKAWCIPIPNHDGKADIRCFFIDDIVSIAEFGDPIYPYLDYKDSICRAPESSLWHTLIEAENYHALQTLMWLYAGKVDCIYIDPPYNTRAKDWKYNNDYVDPSDIWCHSKWLAMMERRLKIAKKLLNPNNSVLIVTIDEKEYLHLGCLLKEIFKTAKMQMISSVINPKGSYRDGFSRSDEYIFFIMFGGCIPERLPLSNEWSSSAVLSSKQDVRKKRVQPGWTSMMRRGTDSLRVDSKGLYYPIYANPHTKRIEKIGDVIPMGQDRGPDYKGLVQILPIRSNGDQGRWQVGNQELEKRIEQGRVRLGKATSYGYVVNYLPDGEWNDIQNGLYEIKGYDSDGSLIAYKREEASDRLRYPPTQWKVSSHNASENGSTLLSSIMGEGRKFPFPKSLYAVHDTLRFFVANKPNALILDFFAGSGTTLHAVNLLNAADGGQRRCILVTNNDVSADEEKALRDQGYKPGDDAWEELGIARHVTWPRTVCSIRGENVHGEPLKGQYLGTERDMAAGFAANAIYFKLGFLDKTSVALGRQFAALLSMLWLKAGAVGECPVLDGAEPLPSMLLYPANRFAVLLDEDLIEDFAERVREHPQIDTIYFVTDSDDIYKKRVARFPGKHCFQLYSDYLLNFKINFERR